MSLKVNEFNIKANVIEDETGADSSESDVDNNQISDSVKQEIIDECVKRMQELMEREKSRF
jgi:hypothetical protein